jgi:hypothetical protein
MLLSIGVDDCAATTNNGGVGEYDGDGGNGPPYLV